MEWTPKEFKCDYCGQVFTAARMLKVHEQIAHPAKSISMKTIETIASGTDLWGYNCEICGQFQSLSEEYVPGKHIILTICNACKADLKSIILNKRRNEGR